MSRNVPKKRRLKKFLRLEKIMEGLKQGKQLYEIAQDVGCSEKTIDRDIADWKENGGFDKWLLSEYIRLHKLELAKENGGQAYKTVADLLKRRLTETQEIHTQGVLKLDINKDIDALIKFSREDDEPEAANSEG